MKKTKTQKGITLIALIITIVVLLVLASVAINSIQNDGIIGHAQSTKDQFEQAQKDEQDVLEYYELVLAGKAWEVGAPVTVTNADGTTEEKIPVTTAKGEKVYVGDTVAYDPTATTTASLYNGESSVKLAASDPRLTYTALPSETGSTYTFKYDAQIAKDAGLKWKILGAENGKLLLVSDSKVATWYDDTVNKDDLPEGTDETLVNHAIQFKKAGYNNGLNILQNIANIYSHGKGVVGARILNHSDIDKLSGKGPNDYNNSLESDEKISEYGNIITLTLNEGNILSYVGSNGASGEINLSETDYATYNDSKFQYYDEITGEIKDLNVGESVTIKNTYYWYNYADAEKTDTTKGNNSQVYKILADTANTYGTRRIVLADRVFTFIDGYGYYAYTRCHLGVIKGDSKGYITDKGTLFYTDDTPVERNNNKYGFNSLRVVVEVDPAYALQGEEDGTYTLSSEPNA